MTKKRMSGRTNKPGVDWSIDDLTAKDAAKIKRLEKAKTAVDVAAIVENKPIAKKIPPVARGCDRQWVKCRDCGRVFYYDYVPYSLSNPIMWTPCGHSGIARDLNCDDITADEAMVLLSQESAS